MTDMGWKALSQSARSVALGFDEFLQSGRRERWCDERDGLRDTGGLRPLMGVGVGFESPGHARLEILDPRGGGAAAPGASTGIDRVAAIVVFIDRSEFTHDPRAAVGGSDRASLSHAVTLQHRGVGRRFEIWCEVEGAGGQLVIKGFREFWEGGRELGDKFFLGRSAQAGEGLPALIFGIEGSLTRDLQPVVVDQQAHLGDLAVGMRGAELTELFHAGEPGLHFGVPRAIRRGRGGGGKLGELLLGELQVAGGGVALAAEVGDLAFQIGRAPEECLLLVALRGNQTGLVETGASESGEHSAEQDKVRASHGVGTAAGRRGTRNFCNLAGSTGHLR